MSGVEPIRSNIGPTTPCVSYFPMPPKRSKSTRRATKKDTPKKATSLPNLRDIKDACLEEYGKSKNTKRAYKGHLARGKQFLQDMVAERRADGADKDNIDTNILAKAFDNPPNKYSAMALELFITQKCFSEGCGKSTCEGIHATFAAYWDEMYAHLKFRIWTNHLITIFGMQGRTEVC